MSRKKQKPLPWYRRIPTVRLPKRLLILAGIVLATLVIGTQLLYPREKGLWFAAVDGVSVRLMDRSEMAKLISEKFAETRVRLTVGDEKTVEFAVKAAGAEPNTEAMIETLSVYPLWQRFIPGSILWQQGNLTSANMYYTNTPFKEFVGAKAKELSFPPQNARLAIKDGAVVATEAIEGSEVRGDVLLETISQADIWLGRTTTLQVPAKRTRAERSSQDVWQVRVAAEATLAHTVTITAGSRTFSPKKEEIASWILLDDVDGNVHLRVDKAKVKAYLSGLNKELGTPAGQTDITIVDGREIGRTTGASGTALNTDAMADQIAEGLLAPSPQVKLGAQFVEVLPSVIFNSKYTTTQEGLRAYVNDVARTKNIRIAIQQIDGEKWSAGGRADESTPSGSTYKVFIAMILFDKMEKGEINWDDPMLDTTVSGCFDRMTIASTNPCAEAWIAQFGRDYINNYVRERGFGGTTFTARDAVRTTAADLTKFMIGLNDGSIIREPYRSRLLSSLGRHPYRDGIPSGSLGIVNDKVGFLWEYIHDAAIVKHPRGAYVMTVMTKGYSYGTIASITREVERIMYP